MYSIKSRHQKHGTTFSFLTKPRMSDFVYTIPQQLLLATVVIYRYTRLDYQRKLACSGSRKPVDV